MGASVARWKTLPPPQVDNTVREGKNNSVIKTLCYILLKKGLHVTALFMSRVGHTHNSLGGLMGARRCFRLSLSIEIGCVGFVKALSRGTIA